MRDLSEADWAEARLVNRSKGKFVHDDIPAVRTALVVIDMQSYFLESTSPAFVPQAVEIVPAINALANDLRARGGMVVWVRTMYSAAAEDSISHFHRILLKPAAYQFRKAALQEGAELSLVWPGLDVRPDDTIVTKTRYSAFAEGASDLDRRLRDRGIEAVLVAGTMTNVCCDSTARDAMMLNYRTTMLRDANASLTEHEHEAALLNFHRYFGDVASCRDLSDRFASKQ